jgi:hypothetical protein
MSLVILDLNRDSVTINFLYVYTKSTIGLKKTYLGVESSMARKKAYSPLSFINNLTD